MAAVTKFEVFSEDLCKGNHDFENDTLKVALTNTEPDAATDEVFADITEITTGDVYVTGGADVQNTVSRTGAITSILGVDVNWTAGTDDIGPYQYSVLYNDTATGKPLIQYWTRSGANTALGAEDDEIEIRFNEDNEPSVVFRVGT